MVKPMAKDYNLFVPESKEGSASAGETVINRRQFLRYGFNTATGVLAASLGVLGFAAILLPPGGGSAGDLSVKFWAKGREDTAWYGPKHLQSMTKADFVAEAANSNTGTAGAAGVWNGVPVVVTYVEDSKWQGSPTDNNKARFQICLLYTSPSPRD